MNLTRVFESTYRRERNPNATGMANPGDDNEFAPQNNPYANGLDPEDMDDGETPTESPEEERAITRSQQRRLDAALRGARADEEEDEAQDLDDLQDIADQGDDDEDEDEDEDEAEEEGEMSGSERAIRTVCAKCGEAAKVTPPKGHRFAKLSELGEDEADGTMADKFRRDLVKWRCRACESVNKTKLRHHRLVKSRTDAAEAFRRTYGNLTGAAPLRESTGSGDAAARVFHDVYGDASDRALWRECLSQHRG